MSIVNGRLLSEKLLETSKSIIATLRQPPKVALVQVGSLPESSVYLRIKRNAFRKAPLINYLQSKSADEGVNGILVQLPLPPGWDTPSILTHIRSSKDIDVLNPNNLGQVLITDGTPTFTPCIPLSISHILKTAGIDIRGMHAVVIGESNLVGLPTAALLRKSGATVTICHKDTSDLSKHTSDADVLVSAVGKASLVTGDMVKPGVVAMDVGIQKGTDGQIYGDLDFPSLAAKASLITPVPGGVGPICVAMLV